MQQALHKITEWKNNWCVTINKETTATFFSLFTKTQAGKLHIEETPSGTKTSRLISE
jgi:hypothetical protein